MKQAYLAELIEAVSSGLTSLGSQRLKRHLRFLYSSQQPDGGFAGRGHASDLYYTGFALRAISCVERALDKLGPGKESLGAAGGRAETESRTAEAETARRCVEVGTGDYVRVERMLEFLRAEKGRWPRGMPTNLIGLHSLLDCTRLLAERGVEAVGAELRRESLEALARFRRPDGGFARSLIAPSSSTYCTFLAVLCYEHLFEPVPAPDALAAFLLSRQLPDGSFGEHKRGKRGGTNPTAAAAVTLARLGLISEKLRQQITEFFLAMQTSEGGLRASALAPAADLLSTFSAFAACVALGVPSLLGLNRVRLFAYANELGSGGFRAGRWDDRTDPEYTFYGLATVGLCTYAARP